MLYLGTYLLIGLAVMLSGTMQMDAMKSGTDKDVDEAKHVMRSMPYLAALVWLFVISFWLPLSIICAYRKLVSNK